MRRRALELAHAGLARVAAHDRRQHPASEPDVAPAEAAVARHPGQQVPARDGELLRQGVAAEVDHLQAVVQGRRHRVHVVGGGDEEHAAEVVLGLEVVVTEGVVVGRVQHLHEGRRRTPPPVAVQLVELVEQHDGVVHPGFGQPFDDAARHRPDVRAPMPADLGLVAHPAEGHAHEGPAQRGGDALRHAALARTRRTGQADDGGGLVLGFPRGVPARLGRVGPHPADGQILEDAVLDVVETVVRPGQVAGHLGHIHLHRGQPAPGQVEHRVEEAADDGDLGAQGRRLLELGQLAGDQPPRRRRGLLLGGALRVTGQIVVRHVAALFDLVAQYAQLLVQEHLALGALHALLDLEADLPLDVQDRVLFGEALEQREEALLRAHRLQQRLLLPRLDLQVGGDDIGQLARVVRLLHHELRLVGELRVQAHIADELVADAAGEAACPRRPRVRALDGDVLDHQVGITGHDPLGAHALIALDQGLHAPVRQAEELQHPGPHADRAQILEGGILHGGFALGTEDERALSGERGLYRRDRALATDEDGGDHPGEQDEVARRQKGQGRRVVALPLRRRVGLLRQTRRHAPAATCRPRSGGWGRCPSRWSPG